MVENLRELWRFRDLLRQLVRRELKVRYKNSALGFAWSIVPPLLQVLVYTFFVKTALGVHAGNASPYMLCGLIPWTFITTATLDSSQSLLINFPIIKKVYMPREVIPLAIIISNFIHFMLGWAVYFVAYVIVLRPFVWGTPLLPTMFFFPIITTVTVFFVTGLSLWAAALNVFYEDVKFILQTSFNLLLLLFPVFYPADVISNGSFFRSHPALFKVYMLNPVTAVMEGYRKTLLEPIPQDSFNLDKLGYPPVLLNMDWVTFTGAALLSVLFAWSGYWYFNKRKWQFVERP